GRDTHPVRADAGTGADRRAAAAAPASYPPLLAADRHGTQTGLGARDEPRPGDLPRVLGGGDPGALRGRVRCRAVCPRVAGDTGGATVRLRAPFPWFGGKGPIAAAVWRRFGDVPNYVEPFAGS